MSMDLLCDAKLTTTQPRSGDMSDSRTCMSLSDHSRRLLVPASKKSLSQ